jgi:hypothetical protein
LLLGEAPHLAHESLSGGATRENPAENFFVQIQHYAYEGDTALHMAAAAHDKSLAAELIALGADVRARNRRGQEPLHYAADGGPSANAQAQAAVIAALIAAGADPKAVDKGGVSPLHRAIRNRRAAAVKALLDLGADPFAPNGSGSTPLTLATLTTGKSGSGSPRARAEQAEILLLLEKSGVT